tara:strand:+ start:62 stop:262 length:201 start_codon:yes stop_codon:yes gene_type:complete
VKKIMVNIKINRINRTIFSLILIKDNHSFKDIVKISPINILNKPSFEKKSRETKQIAKTIAVRIRV